MPEKLRSAWFGETACCGETSVVREYTVAINAAAPQSDVTFRFVQTVWASQPLDVGEGIV